MLNREKEEGTHLWTFEKITNHRKNTTSGKQIMEVEVLWDTGERLNVMKTDDLVTVAHFVKEKNLQDQPYWKWANRYAKNPKKFLRYCIYSAKKRNGTVFKFRFKVP